MDDYKIIVEQDNSTVVGRYEPPRRDGGGYQSEARLEAEFIKQLVGQGYEYAKQVKNEIASIPVVRGIFLPQNLEIPKKSFTFASTYRYAGVPPAPIASVHKKNRPYCATVLKSNEKCQPFVTFNAPIARSLQTFLYLCTQIFNLNTYLSWQDLSKKHPY